MIHANIDAIRDKALEGLSRARRLILVGEHGLAVQTIDAAMSFHPMYAEDWPGWPEEA